MLLLLDVLLSFQLLVTPKIGETESLKGPLFKDPKTLELFHRDALENYIFIGKSLTQFRPMFPSIPPENIRKPKVF